MLVDHPEPRPSRSLIAEDLLLAASSQHPTSTCKPTNCGKGQANPLIIIKEKRHITKLNVVCNDNTLNLNYGHASKPSVGVIRPHASQQFFCMVK